MAARRICLHLSWACAAALGAVLWCLGSGASAQVVTARPPPTPLVQRVGARIVTAKTIHQLPKGTFALLFLFAKDQENQLICDRFINMYQSSLADRGPYEKLVYLPIKSDPPPNKIDCLQASNSYDQMLWDDLAAYPNLYLDRLGGDRSAYLMLIKRDASGDLFNVGYMIFTGQTQDVIDGELRVFNLYYQQDPGCWVVGRIREKGYVERLMDTVNLFGLHCAYR